MQGKVKWFSPEKGYGFLTADDGKEYFAHIHEIDPDAGDLAEGQSVEFEPSSGPKGLKALKVRAVAAILLLAAATFLGLGGIGCSSAALTGDKLNVDRGMYTATVSGQDIQKIVVNPDGSVVVTAKVGTK